MRWLKANNQATSSSSLSSKKDLKAAAKKSTNYQKSNIKESPERVGSSRTVIVFNPLLWKEEIVNLIED